MTDQSAKVLEQSARITQLEEALGQIFRHAVRPEAKMDVIERIARTALTPFLIPREDETT